MPNERRMFTGPAGQLEGIVHRPEDAPVGVAVVCHPHPLYGGEMENNVVDAAVRGFLAAGWLAARFNFRGVGASSGQHDNGKGEVDDAGAVLTALRQEADLAGLPVAIAGYSFGGGVALRLFLDDGSIQLGVGVAPAVSTLPSRPATDARPLLILSGTRDEYAAPDVVQRWAGDSQTEIEIVGGADHFFWGHERSVESAISRIAQDVAANRQA